LILLDTNVWSILPHAGREPQIEAWIAERNDKIWLSVIAVAEIRMGIENPLAAAKKTRLQEWLADLELLYAKRILEFDLAAAHVFGKLVAQKKLQKQETKLLDIQLAAQALARDAIVATRNVKDFEWTGVRMVNPWEG
jgi:toxin FitB